MASKNARRTATTVFRYSIIILFFGMILFPYSWLLLSSFKSEKDLLSTDPKLLFIPTSENYQRAANDPEFVKAFVNSVIISSAVTILAVLFGSIGAYALGSLKFPGKRPYLLAVLLSNLLPGVVILIPLFLLFHSVGLIGTYQGIIIAYLSFTLTTVLWIMRAYFESIPRQLAESALIDGCSRLGALFRVILPISGPGLTAIAVISFIGVWKELMWALVLTKSDTQTLPIRIAGYIGQMHDPKYTLMIAGGILSSVPVVLLALFLQRYLVSGLTAGAVKG